MAMMKQLYIYKNVLSNITDLMMQKELGVVCLIVDIDRASEYVHCDWLFQPIDGSV